MELLHMFNNLRRGQGRLGGGIAFFTKAKQADRSLALRKVLLWNLRHSGLDQFRVELLDEIKSPGGEYHRFLVKHLIGRKDFAVDAENDGLRQTQRNERSVEQTAIPRFKGRAR